MRYFYCKLNMAMEKRMYECYVTDCLYYLNLSNGTQFKKRYRELLYPEKDDNKTPQQVFDEIKTRFGLKVVND